MLIMADGGRRAYWPCPTPSILANEYGQAMAPPRNMPGCRWSGSTGPSTKLLAKAFIPVYGDGRCRRPVDVSQHADRLAPRGARRPTPPVRRWCKSWSSSAPIRTPKRFRPTHLSRQHHARSPATRPSLTTLIDSLKDQQRGDKVVLHSAALRPRGGEARRPARASAGAVRFGRYAHALGQRLGRIQRRHAGLGELALGAGHRELQHGAGLRQVWLRGPKCN